MWHTDCDSSLKKERNNEQTNEQILRLKSGVVLFVWSLLKPLAAVRALESRNAHSQARRGFTDNGSWTALAFTKSSQLPAASDPVSLDSLHRQTGLA